MMVAIAFISGMSVTAISFFIPHARESTSSVEDFKTLQETLAKLPAPSVKMHHNV